MSGMAFFSNVLAQFENLYVILHPEKTGHTHMKDQRKKLIIMKSTLGRLPSYYCDIEAREAAGEQYVSASAIAATLGINPVQVRKDLASVSSEPGRPKLGFRVSTLLEDIKAYLGYDRYDEAVLVGVGALGRVLLQYGGFANYGLGIVAGFDREVAEDSIAGKPLLPMTKLVSFLKRTHIKIGIVAVPASAAQEVADMLVAGGVQAIWNFAPTTLVLPERVLVKNENLAASLAVLSLELMRLSQVGK